MAGEEEIGAAFDVRKCMPQWLHEGGHNLLWPTQFVDWMGDHPKGIRAEQLFRLRRAIVADQGRQTLPSGELGLVQAGGT
jgi:hypothetical protein